jgi:hypothetical protein
MGSASDRRIMGVSRYRALAGVFLVAMALGLGAWAYRTLLPYPEIGGVYLAKQVCSCLFVAGRSEGSCRAEFEPDISRFDLSVDRSGLPAHAKVTTRLAVFSGEATYADGYGCTVSK